MATEAPARPPSESEVLADVNAALADGKDNPSKPLKDRLEKERRERENGSNGHVDAEAEKEAYREADERSREKERRTAMSPKGFYMLTRREGHAHAPALERVASAYGSADVTRHADGWLTEWEESQSPARADALPAEHLATPDAIDLFQHAAIERVEELREQEAALSLDAIEEPAKAAELARVRADRGNAEAEIQQAEDARLERGRREREAARQADEDAKQSARRGAAAVAKKMATQADKVDVALEAAVEAIAAYQKLWTQRRSLMVTAGDAQSIGQPTPEVTGAFYHFLQAKGMLGLVDFTQRCHPRPLGSITK